MASIRKARNELLVSFCEEIINEDEFLLLYHVNKSKNPEYPYWNYERFTLQDKSEAECKIFVSKNTFLFWLMFLAYLTK